MSAYTKEHQLDAPKGGIFLCIIVSRYLFPLGSQIKATSWFEYHTGEDGVRGNFFLHLYGLSADSSYIFMGSQLTYPWPLPSSSLELWIFSSSCILIVACSGMYILPWLWRCVHWQFLRQVDPVCYIITNWMHVHFPPYLLNKLFCSLGYVQSLCIRCD